MKRVIASFLGIIFLLSPGVIFSKDFFSKKVVEKIDKHAAAVAVYYEMSQEEWTRRMSLRGNIIQPELPLDIKTRPNPCIAYIGAGGVLPENRVLTADHLLGHDENTYSQTIYVFIKGHAKVYEADVFARTNQYPNPENKVMLNDYAVLQLREDVNLPGLRVANKDAKLLNKVMWLGSMGGLAFYLRGGFVTYVHQFFKKDTDGKLHLARWETPYYCVHPGGHGDSGGMLFNKKGEILSVMYCGVVNNHESLVFANPSIHLWNFLKDAGLEGVIKK